MNLSDYFVSCTWDEADENLVHIPITWMDPTDNNAANWSSAYRATLNYADIIPTLSGGISKAPMNFRYYSKLLDVTKNSISLYIVEPDHCYALRFRDAFRKPDDGESLSGSVAFNKFRRLLKKNGYDIGDLAIPNGKEVKETIAPPDIRLIPEFRDKILERAFHVDINSAYFAGIEKHFGYCGDGAMSETIRYVYDHRSDGTPTTRYNKSILVCAQGFAQSQWCRFTAPGEESPKGYSLAHLSKAGIEDCKKTLGEIIKLYEKIGCKLVATNTDGAWFVPPIGHAGNLNYLRGVPGYGMGLGEFKIDHYDCLLRYRSKGAYEYIENGTYKPVIRGQTHLDFEKPRSQWEWGDIYHKQAYVIRWRFIEDKQAIDLNIPGGGIYRF